MRSGDACARIAGGFMALLHDVHRHRAGEARHVDADHLACESRMLSREARITGGKAHHADARPLGKPGKTGCEGETRQPLVLPSETVGQVCQARREGQAGETLRLCKARSQSGETGCVGQARKTVS
jgi:hypothetical protein